MTVQLCGAQRDTPDYCSDGEQPNDHDHPNVNLDLGGDDGAERQDGRGEEEEPALGHDRAGRWAVPTRRDDLLAAMLVACW